MNDSHISQEEHIQKFRLLDPWKYPHPVRFIWYLHPYSSKKRTLKLWLRKDGNQYDAMRLKIYLNTVNELAYETFCFTRIEIDVSPGENGRYIFIDRHNDGYGGERQLCECEYFSFVLEEVSFDEV